MQHSLAWPILMLPGSFILNVRLIKMWCRMYLSEIHDQSLWLNRVRCICCICYSLLLLPLPKKWHTKFHPHFRKTGISRKFYHDDVIKWKHFPPNWPFVRGIHRSPVNSPHKGQWRGALMFSLICVWINDWVNNREVGDLRCYHAHYDATVMYENGDENLM